jgi:hypothetical protein
MCCVHNLQIHVYFSAYFVFSFLCISLVAKISEQHAHTVAGPTESAGSQNVLGDSVVFIKYVSENEHSVHIHS